MPPPARLALLCVALALPLPGRAGPPEPLPPPAGPPVLTVTGAIAVTNADGAAVFDMAMLQSLGAEEMRTSTPWTEGAQLFRGVPLHRLTERLGVAEGLLIAMAINDYNAEIPAEDARPGGAMIAWEMNGAPIPLRGPGPLWIVYPFDASTVYQTQVIFSRSVWQLDRIEVRPAAGGGS